MRVYRVWVDYFYEGKKKRPMRRSIELLIDAESCEMAFDGAAEAAEMCVPVGPRYLAFETRDAAPVEFPYVLRTSAEKYAAPKGVICG